MLLNDWNVVVTLIITVWTDALKDTKNGVRELLPQTHEKQLHVRWYDLIKNRSTATEAKN